MGNWVVDLDNIIYTRIDSKLEKAFRAKYPDMYVTNSDVNKGVAKFPTIYIHILPNAEVGQDLDNSTINAVMYGMQLEVSSTNQIHVKDIMSELVNIMKSMRFEITAMPEFRNQDTLYRQVCRVRRVIGANDKF